jgi:hypothetical protein
MCLFLLAVLALPILSAVNAAGRGECGVLVISDAFVALTAIVHLGLMQWGIMRHRRLPAPLCVSPEAEWCCFLAFMLMVVVAFCIGTDQEYTSRYILAPAMVCCVTLAWQFVQCKPAMVTRDETYDHIMQDAKSIAPPVQDPPRPDANNNERVSAFLTYCQAHYPATVFMVRVLTKQLRADPPMHTSEDRQQLLLEQNRLQFLEFRSRRGVPNSFFVGQEMPISDIINLSDTASLRLFAYEFLLDMCGTLFVGECSRRARLVQQMTSPMYAHPALMGYDTWKEGMIA